MQTILPPFLPCQTSTTAACLPACLPFALPAAFMPCLPVLLHAHPLPCLGCYAPFVCYTALPTAWPAYPLYNQVVRCLPFLPSTLWDLPPPTMPGLPHRLPACCHLPTTPTYLDVCAAGLAFMRSGLVGTPLCYCYSSMLALHACTPATPHLPLPLLLLCLPLLPCLLPACTATAHTHDFPHTTCTPAFLLSSHHLHATGTPCMPACTPCFCTFLHMPTYYAFVWNIFIPRPSPGLLLSSPLPLVLLHPSYFSLSLPYPQLFFPLQIFVPFLGGWVVVVVCTFCHTLRSTFPFTFVPFEFVCALPCITRAVSPLPLLLPLPFTLWGFFCLFLCTFWVLGVTFLIWLLRFALHLHHGYTFTCCTLHHLAGLPAARTRRLFPPPSMGVSHTHTTLFICLSYTHFAT